jgi:hypothetical protein
MGGELCMSLVYGCVEQYDRGSHWDVNAYNPLLDVYVTSNVGGYLVYGVETNWPRENGQVPTLSSIQAHIALLDNTDPTFAPRKEAMDAFLRLYNAGFPEEPIDDDTQNPDDMYRYNVLVSHMTPKVADWIVVMYGETEIYSTPIDVPSTTVGLESYGPGAASSKPVNSA